MTSSRPAPWSTIVVAALGFGADAYDAVLFPVVRAESLAALGLSGEANASAGVSLLGLQFVGMCAGSFLFGVYADKAGRVRALRASIALYSLATLANAGVGSVPIYGVLRFASGVGLAGELGIAITLASELLPSKGRSYGTLVVGLLGALGGILSASINQHLPWRLAYVLGGCLGLALLVVRWQMHDSTVFATQQDTVQARGSLREIISAPGLWAPSLAWVLVGAPLTLVVAYFVTLAPDYGRALHASTSVTAGNALVAVYSGLACGEIAFSWLSERTAQRRSAIAMGLVSVFLPLGYFMTAHAITPNGYYGTGVAIGISLGYWTVYLTAVSEYFPTRMRATMTTAIVNLTRVTIYPFGLLYAWLASDQPEPAAFAWTLAACLIAGAVCLALLRDRCDPALATAKPRRHGAAVDLDG